MLEQVVDKLSTLFEIDEEIVRIGKENIYGWRVKSMKRMNGVNSNKKVLTINLEYRNLMRLIESLRNVVEVNRAVESYETDLGTRVAWKIIQLILDRLTRDFEISALLCER